MLKTLRAPIIPRRPKYGLLIFLKRDDGAVAAKISIMPRGTPVINAYGVRVTMMTDILSPPDVLHLSEALSLASSLAKGLENRYVGKSTSQLK